MNDGEAKVSLGAVFEPDDYLYFYEDGLSGKQTDQEVDFIVRELDLKEPKRLLDLGCGYGRHANRLAALGHTVTGVDFVQGFLEKATRDAKEAAVTVQYILKDMREIDFDQTFDCVIFMSGSFGYCSDEDNLRILQNVSRALERDGPFLLDMPNRDFFIRSFLPCIVDQKDKDLMIDLNRLDITEGRLYDKKIVLRNGVMKEKPFSLRLYAPTEIRDVLEGANLRVLRFLGYYDSSPLRVTSRRMIVIAQKN